MQIYWVEYILIKKTFNASLLYYLYKRSAVSFYAIVSHPPIMMLTTPELRSQFEVSFSKLTRSLPADLRKKWDGTITWKDEHSYPGIPQEIIQQLTPAAKATYVTLLNKLSRGKI